MAGTTGDNQEDSLRKAVRQFIDAQLQGQKPDIEEFVRQYPEFEDRIRQKVQNLQRIDTLFDSLVQADEADFEDTVTSQDLVGLTLGHFEIVEMIGRGGMGIVYLARDTKLKRSVAIKSIPAALAADSTARTRFRREAELLASLNHPNISVIHEIIEEKKSGYLVLEYVPGQTLAERIAKGPLKLQEALTISLQIAEAVAAAHDHDVIHRDLKPGNIKITPEDKIKVLDFGLAKTVGGESSEKPTTVTQPGRVIGTPAYMSPEQARGEPTNKRSDIWAFGCVLYEMLTGHLPFEGETATEIMARIIEREPPWQVLPQNTPSNIQVLLHRCLEKDPRRRLRDIGDAALEIKETLSLLGTAPAFRPVAPVRTLSRWTMLTGLAVGALLVLLVVGLNIGRWGEHLLGEVSLGQIESLAVLPLDNLSGDPEQEYFADGMTEALIADLGKIGAVQVRSRTSIMQYKDTKKPLSEIARELNVDVIVEGSVLCFGEQVRITAQLIHTPTDTHIWAESYERDMGDVIALQREVARAIVREIKVAVTPTEKKRLASADPVNPEAYQANLLGRHYQSRFTTEDIMKGIECFQQAIAIDPNYALPYSGLADSYNFLGNFGVLSPNEASPKAREAALKALEIDDTLAEAHTSLAYVRMNYDWDWEEAGKEYKRAMELNPSYTRAHSLYAWYLSAQGRHDEALAKIRLIMELDPMYPHGYGWTLHMARRHGEAIEHLQKMVDIHPTNVGQHGALGMAYEQKKMYEEAILEFQKAKSLSGGNPSDTAWLGHAYAVSGQREEAQKVITELKELSKQRYVSSYGLAAVYIGLGKKAEAMTRLEKAYEQRDGWLVGWIKVDPRFDSLRSDPRFQDLLRRLNFPE